MARHARSRGTAHLRDYDRGAAPESPNSFDEATESDLRIMRRLAVGMFLVGALNPFLTVFAFKQDVGDRLSQLILASLLVVAGIALAIGPPRLAALRMAPFYGIAIISAICATVRPLGETPYFYLWPVVFSAYVFSRRHVLLAMVEMVIAYGSPCSSGRTPLTRSTCSWESSAPSR